MRRLLFAIIALAGLLIVAPSVAQPAEPGPEELRTLAKLRGIRRSSRGCRPRPRATPTRTPNARRSVPA
jgi:hypothetical protein